MTRRQKITVLLLFVPGLVAGFIFGFAAARAETVMYVNVKPGTVLNVRWEPNRKAEVIARFDRGDKVYVQGIEKEWAALLVAGDTLYAALEYLSDVPPMAEAKAYEVTGNGRVRVRNKPGGTKVVRWVQPGDVVEVIGWRQGFAVLSDGFVDGQYLKEIKK